MIQHVQIDVTQIEETDKAVFVEVPDCDGSNRIREVWIPRSIIRYKRMKDKQGIMQVPLWFAKKKFIDYEEID